MLQELPLQLRLRVWVNVLRKCHGNVLENSADLTDCRQPKGQPKPATAAKPATDGTATRGAGRGRGGRRGRNAGRAKPKTAEELDAEMMDYFDASGAPANGAATTDAAATTNGTAQPAANGGEDLGMDEVLVSADGPLAQVCLLTAGQ